MKASETRQAVGAAHRGMQGMARFTNQFELMDPLEFSASGVFDLWPRQFAWEARHLTLGRSSSDLTVIARSMDQMIEARAAQEIGMGPSSLAEASTLNPKRSRLLRPREATADGIAAVRSFDGDLNLYRDAGGAHALLLRFDECRALKVQEWEAYATLALWKLIDMRAALSVVTRRGMARRNGRKPPTVVDDPSANLSDVSLVMRAASVLVEVGCACTLASEAKLRHDSMALATVPPAVISRLRELEAAQAARGRQARRAARTAAAHRWSPLEAHKAQALELARGGSFRSRAAAARFAADRISKDEQGNSYTAETIDGWLKAAGWAPTK